MRARMLTAIWCAARVGSSVRAASDVVPMTTASIDPERSSRLRPADSSGRISVQLGRVRRATASVAADHHGERRGGQHLGDHRRPRRPRHAEVQAEHEHHLEHGVEGVGRDQHDHRRAVVGRRRAACPGRTARRSPPAARRRRCAGRSWRSRAPRPSRRGRGRAARRRRRRAAQRDADDAPSHIACTPASAAPVRSPAPMRRATRSVVP